MKITSIDVNNYIGIKSLKLDISAPAVLFAGPNGAGKSSVAEAIRHALLDAPGRVNLKKHYPSLLNHGASAGHAIIKTDQGEYAIILPKGDHAGDTSALSFALPYCLSPELFAGLDQPQKRHFLFKLMGVKITPDEIAKRLESHGACPEKSKDIRPHLSGGFESASKHASEMARQSKADWRAVTNETYGEKKAEGWAMPIPQAPELVASDEAIEALYFELDNLSQKCGNLLGQIDRARIDMKEANGRTEKIAELREKAAKYARIQNKINLDQAELDGWNAKIKTAEGDAAGYEYNMPLNCPHCAGVVVLNQQDKLLEKYEAPKAPKSDPKLPEYIKARDLMMNAVANGKRDLDAANKAAIEADQLESIKAPSDDEFEALKAEYSAVLKAFESKKAERDAMRKDLDSLKEAQRATAAAEQANKRAAQHHADVQGWDKIAALLSPDGIPAEMLSEALGPFNETLQKHAAKSNWASVRINSDMEITCDSFDTPYALRSESEKWRADAMTAAAIAEISGVRMIMLDRFDVLDLKGRADLIEWIGGCGLDCVILMGTLKALPAAMPDYIESHWIGD